MRRTTVLAALFTALLLVLPTAAADPVDLKSSWTIKQPGNNVDISISNQFSVEQLTAYSTATRIDRSNFSITGSTSDHIAVNLSWFNQTAVAGEYVANFSAATADGNDVNFSMELPEGQAYRVFRDETQMKTVDSLSGPLWFNQSSWSSHTFSVKQQEPDPAYFDVTITGTNDPVEEGDLLEVTAGIENTGDASATQTVVLEIDGEQVDSTSGSLSGGQSTSVTFSYVTADGDAGDRTATVASDDDTDSTTVTIETADSGDGDSGSDTGSSGSSTSPSDDTGDLQNVTVSSALEELPIGTKTTGSVTAENPSAENVALEIIERADASCDFISLADEDEWGSTEYELPANTTRTIEYEIDLTTVEADQLEVGDSVTCTYDVIIPEREDTEFAVTAEITAPGLFPGLSITGPVDDVSSDRGPVVVGIVIVFTVIFGVWWSRR